jgi:hypothetical protein
MKKFVSKHITPRRTGLGACSLKLGRVVPGIIKQDFKRSGLGDVDFELGRTNQNFIEKHFGSTVPGVIENFGRLGLGDAKHLGRTTPGNLTIKFGRTAAGYLYLSRAVAGNVQFTPTICNARAFGRSTVGS